MMKITHSLSVDLQHSGSQNRIYAKQGDRLTREVTINLFNGGSVWAAPSDVTVLQLAYCKSDKVGGCYDHMTDNSVAGKFNSARTAVTMQLHPQVLNVAGNVFCELRLLTNAGDILNTFNFIINVQKSPIAMTSASEGYYNNVFDGATYTPTVNEAGILSWTNNKNLPNPPSQNIRGPKGDPGSPGSQKVKYLIQQTRLGVLRLVTEDNHVATGQNLDDDIESHNAIFAYYEAILYTFGGKLDDEYIFYSHNEADDLLIIRIDSDGNVIDQHATPIGAGGDGGIPIARGEDRLGIDVYDARGSDLPDVRIGSSGHHQGKGKQVVFIPDSENFTSPTKLKINDGEAIEIRMRAAKNRGENDERPDATELVPAHAIMTGVPYTLTFCGKYWLVDSMIGSGETSDHRQLSHRDAPNQHPMSAIEGLIAALGGKEDKPEALTWDAQQYPELIDFLRSITEVGKYEFRRDSDDGYLYQYELTVADDGEEREYYGFLRYFVCDEPVLGYRVYIGEPGTERFYEHPNLSLTTRQDLENALGDIESALNTIRGVTE